VSRPLSQRGTLQIPVESGSAATIQSLRRQGLVVIGSNPNALNNTARNVGTTAASTYRSEHYATQAASSLRLVYANWYWGANNINPNQILVKAALQKLSPNGSNGDEQTKVAVAFSGSRYKVIDGMTVLISDPISFRVKKGERFFALTSVTASVFGNSPSAPTLTASTTGGALPTGVQYQVALSYVFPTHETSMGAATQSAVTGAGSGNKITITAPSAASGALGYRVWMTAAGGTTSSAFYSMSPIVPFSSNYDSLYVPNVLSPQQTNQVGFPLGSVLLGGTLFYGIDNGEGNNTVADLTDDGGGASINHGTGNSYSPIAILGNVASGPLPPSAALLGDSIQAGKGDDGIGGSTRGGAAYRALTGITGTTITSTFVPSQNIGFVNAGPIPGEKLSNFTDTNSGVPRKAASLLASTVISNYGTNDLYDGSSQEMVRIIKLAYGYTLAGVKFIQETFVPKTTSTDGWRTTTNQTINADNASRVILNNWFRNTATAGSVITGETAHGTANGSNQVFSTSIAFVGGTETVTINGTPTTAYTYDTSTALPDGTTAASGFKFTAAPANGATILVTYTTVPGFATACAPAGSGLADIYDVCTPVEVNSAGTLTPNGGYWLPAPAGSIDTGTVSSANSASITDSTKSWQASGGANAGQKGACVRIITDATTPASVGQVFCIAYNSATQLSTLSTTYSPTPSAGATYEIYRPYTVDGVHPSSDGYKLMAAQIDLTKTK